MDMQKIEQAALMTRWSIPAPPGLESELSTSLEQPPSPDDVPATVLFAGGSGKQVNARGLSKLQPPPGKFNLQPPPGNLAQPPPGIFIPKAGLLADETIRSPPGLVTDETIGAPPGKFTLKTADLPMECPPGKFFVKTSDRTEQAVQLLSGNLNKAICPPPGNFTLKASAFAEEPMQPPPGKFSMKTSHATNEPMHFPPGKFMPKPCDVIEEESVQPPPGYFPSPCQLPDDPLPPSLPDQPVFLTPTDYASFGKRSCLSKQMPPGNWDTMSLASTCVGDDGSVPSMGTLPDFEFSESEELMMESIAGNQDAHVYEEFKPKRVKFGKVEHVTYVKEDYALPRSPDMPVKSNGRVKEDDALTLCPGMPLQANGLGAHYVTNRALAGPAQSTTDEPLLFQWLVDARTLKSSDRQLMSQSFEIAPDACIKLMLKPKCSGNGRGQASFRQSRGEGSVEVTFMGSLTTAPMIRFAISVGDNEERGPVDHDFTKSRVCTLPKDMQQWDFHAAVNRNLQSFLVTLKLLGVYVR